MPELQALAPNLWVVDTPHRFLGLHLGSRMTVVRLKSGKVVLHSPVALSAELAERINAIGPVRHIVCPNRFHHMYAAQAVAAFPEALLHGPAALHKKRRDLKFDALLSATPHPDWQGELLPLTIDGSLLNETVFYHPDSRSLITCDLVENFHRCTHTPTRWYLRLGGILGKVGWHPLLRPLYLNRRRARDSINRLLNWPFERVILSHGNIIQGDAHRAIRDGLAWLY